MLPALTGGAEASASPRSTAKPAPAAGCSLRFDAGLRDDRSIGCRLGTHAAGERLRRAGRDLEGLRSEAVLNPRIAQDPTDLRVEPGDDGLPAVVSTANHDVTGGMLLMPASRSVGTSGRYLVRSPSVTAMGKSCLSLMNCSTALS